MLTTFKRKAETARRERAPEITAELPEITAEPPKNTAEPPKIAVEPPQNTNQPPHNTPQAPPNTTQAPAPLRRKVTLYFKESRPVQKKGGNEGEVVEDDEEDDEEEEDELEEDELEEEEGEAMVVDEEPAVSSLTSFLEIVLTFERVPRDMAQKGLPRELPLQESGRARRRRQKGLRSATPGRSMGAVLLIPIQVGKIPSTKLQIRLPLRYVASIRFIHSSLTGMTVPSVRERAGGLCRFTKRAVQTMQVEEAGVQPDAPEPLNWKNRPPHVFRSRAPGVPHQAGKRIRLGSPEG